MMFNKLLKVECLYKLKNTYRIKKYFQENPSAKYVYEETDIKAKASQNNHTSCYYCNGTGLIVWKSKNNMLLNFSKQPTIVLYSVCSKCQYQ